MGIRKVKVLQSASESIAAVAFFVESKGLTSTALRFSDSVYDFILKLADSRKSFAPCREPVRAMLGYKCVPYKKKYIIMFYESDDEIIICEFVSAKKISW
jgi:plasmid stabilization system protein ParE